MTFELAFQEVLLYTLEVILTTSSMTAAHLTESKQGSKYPLTTVLATI